MGCTILGHFRWGASDGEAYRIFLGDLTQMVYPAILRSEMSTGPLKRLHVKLDVETHKRTKMRATDEGLTIQEYVTHLLKQALYGVQKP